METIQIKSCKDDVYDVLPINKAKRKLEISGISGDCSEKDIELMRNSGLSIYLRNLKNNKEYYFNEGYNTLKLTTHPEKNGYFVIQKIYILTKEMLLDDVNIKIGSMNDIVFDFFLKKRT